MDDRGLWAKTRSHSTSDGNKFTLSPEQLRGLHNPKNLTAFRALGGLRGLEKGLRTDRDSGLSGDEGAIDGVASFDDTLVTWSTGIPKEGPGVAAQKTRSGKPPAEGLFFDRKRVFLDNRLPTKKQLRFLQLMWMTYNDPVLFLLTAAAAVSLAIGLSQTFTDHTPGNPPVEWVEGVAILIAICVIVIVGSANDWEKQRQFRKLNRKQLEREIKVVRSGVSRLISISEVLVGDVVHLEPGDVIPADGILISGHNITCDESTATGESDLVHKSLGDEVFYGLVDRVATQDPINPEPDPFILSGTQVREGIGKFLVTATGINSTYGKILASLRDEPEQTPLQARLNVLAKYIAIAGGVSALLLFVALFIKFLATLHHSSHTSAVKGQNFVDIVIISLTVLVIAVPEGLPLAVTLSLAFASTKMLKDHNLVRHLKACETMGNVTNICSDKTGTLTQNKMVVVAGAIGPHLQFHDEHSTSSSTPDSAGEKTETKSVPPDQFIGTLAPAVKSVLVQSIALNTTAFEGENRESFIGSDTESALLMFALDHLGMGPVGVERSNETITQQIPFSAVRQSMATVVQLPSSTCKYRVFIKGASEVLLAKCSRIIQDPTKGSSDVEMSTRDRQSLIEIIDNYAGQSLRTIGLAYRDFPAPSTIDGETARDKPDFTLDYLEQGLVFLGVVGIRDPLRPGVPEAVLACQRAGVTVRMVTGDNLRTAKAIAHQCGILSDNESDIAMEGAEFRRLSQPEMDQVIPRLKVLARSSPEDKQSLVIRLKEIGEIVAVTGDGTNDASALSAADVSFSMGGLSGTEVAREASSIILMNDDFSCIVKAIMWGRAVNDSVKKFLQVRGHTSGRQLHQG
jgi:P-type Ca2+ transporter type 2C